MKIIEIRIDGFEVKVGKRHYDIAKNIMTHGLYEVAHTSHKNWASGGKDIEVYVTVFEALEAIRKNQI